ncbi:uncharacterized protein LOC128559697 [Mercenaria mercenaria]|uniref:uncharacterized protein LOC128559697 n=1 Tax=Mercenaria mercenaria TaxID=6596 RepID=UPI00234FAB5B|nr:uncharacterized protein LOC128559697 [Mercenaria mercenaria]
MLLVFGHLFSARGAARRCGELSQRNKDNLMVNLTTEDAFGLHWSFWLLPSVQRAAEEQIPRADVSLSKRSKHSFLYGEFGRRCPKRNRPGVNVCPVHYVMQSDKNRIPENIVHVRCNCKHCFHNDSSTLIGKCEKEYIYTPVWRRNETNCEYVKIMESVAVACTCNIKNIEIKPAISKGIYLQPV